MRNRALLTAVRRLLTAAPLARKPRAAVRAADARTPAFTLVDDGVIERLAALSSYGPGGRRFHKGSLAAAVRGIEHRYEDGSRTIVTTHYRPPRLGDVKTWLIQMALRETLRPTERNSAPISYEHHVRDRVSQLATAPWTEETIVVNQQGAIAVEMLTIDADTHVLVCDLRQQIVGMVCFGRVPDSILLDRATI